MKKLLALTLSLVLVFSLTACGDKATDKTTGANRNETVYKIGVIQYVQHDALDAANKGFFAALDEAGINYKADQQNASEEQSACQTIAETLVNNGNDLILAIATPAAIAVVAATSDIPVIVTAVTDPAESGLVASNEAPGGNVTGTSDMNPIVNQMALLHDVLPEAKTVGILYCSAESNSKIQADLAVAACKELGINTEIFTVASSNEIQQMIESMVGKVDCIYAPTDNVIAAGMTTVAMVANENNLPTIVGEGGMVKNGGLCTFGIDYYKLGYLAGLQAIAILKGEASPATTPIGYLDAEDCEFSFNADTAAALGIDVKVFDSYLKK